MNRVVISVIGPDRVGIIAAVSRVLADRHINILSINQTILDGYFNMILIGSLPAESTDIRQLQSDLTALGASLGVDIRAQRADVFEQMHRI